MRRPWDPSESVSLTLRKLKFKSCLLWEKKPRKASRASGRGVRTAGQSCRRAEGGPSLPLPVWESPLSPHVKTLLRSWGPSHSCVLVSVQCRGRAWWPHPPLSLHRAWKQARAYGDKELQAPWCSDCAWGRDTLGYRGPRALGLRGSLPCEAGPGQRREPAPLAATEDNTGERPCLSRGDLLAGRWLWGWEAEPESCRFGGQGWADTLPQEGLSRQHWW